MYKKVYRKTLEILISQFTCAKDKPFCTLSPRPSISPLLVLLFSLKFLRPTITCSVHLVGFSLHNLHSFPCPIWFYFHTTPILLTSLSILNSYVVLCIWYKKIVCATVHFATICFLEMSQKYCYDKATLAWMTLEILRTSPILDDLYVMAEKHMHVQCFYPKTPIFVDTLSMGIPL